MGALSFFNSQFSILNSQFSILNSVATVWIPSLLRSFTGGLAEVNVPGNSMRELIDGLEQRYPGIQARLLTEEGRVKPNIAVVVDGVNSKQGLRQPLSDNSEVHFVPAMAGGQ